MLEAMDASLTLQPSSSSSILASPPLMESDFTLNNNNALSLTNLQDLEDLLSVGFTIKSLLEKTIRGSLPIANRLC
uniref:Uncharacterized protein n=1 Tax=Nelumbo nucifera TaxID=4432 RepID=A0A822Y9J8_NELNU|nr:TPA_asm: hypothetical protein HUJ06_030688 [Nelumbo nucifera]